MSTRTPAKRGAPEGNGNALKDGLYAAIAHRADAEAVAKELRELMPVYSPSFEPQIRTASLLLHQVFAPEPDSLELGSRRSADWNTKVAELRRQLDALGLTPMAMARLGLDLTRTRSLERASDLRAEGRAARERRNGEKK